MGQVLVVALVVGAVVALIGLALRPRTLFVIRVRRGTVHLRGAVPGYGPAAVQELVAQLGLPEGAWVRGVPEGERFRLEFSAGIGADDRQRLRNVLYLRLPP